VNSRYNAPVVPDQLLDALESQGLTTVHFIGIGGIGMAALARWFLARKWTVTGSDMSPSDLTRELQKEGTDFAEGHKKGFASAANLIVRSQAILPTNPEFQEAVKAKVPIVTYPEMIGALSRRYDTIAIAGAHGKSTTTSMMALVALAAKLDPTVIVGTKLKEFGGKNFRAGRSHWLILEADEYGRAFLNYSPRLLIILNIDREHLDTYHNISDIKNTFLELVSRVAGGGSIVLNADNAYLASLEPRIAAIARKNSLKVYWYSLKNAAAKRIKTVLKIPGEHNLSNALAVFSLARRALKIPRDTVLKALGAFKGSWRRYEYKGSYKIGTAGYEVYDDYAHHPTEIRATLQAFKEKFPKSVLVCIFQPHQAERLRKLFPDFKTAFKDADALVLFPEYRVAGRDEHHARFTAKTLAEAVKRRSPRKAVLYIEDPKRFSKDTVREAFLATGLTHRNAVVIMMGAGNIVNYTSKLIS
jgi:UDP-N-acetylmuramate--alanine ligase